MIYGGKDKPEPLQVSERDINAMLSHASGENILVELEIGGDGKAALALVQEVQHSPLGGDILHIDFHAISMDEMIRSRRAARTDGHRERGENFRRIARTKSARLGDRMSARRSAGPHHG